MRIAYFDCFSGVAGDMTVAALLDAGLPMGVLQDTLGRLKLPGVTLTAQKVKRHGIAATHVNVAIDESQPKKHRHLHHIVQIIEAADLPPPVADNAKAVFRRLAEAEAAVHQTTIEKVHFHEVGAADAIVDIVGACAGLHALAIERIACSPVPTGNGTVTCEHGVMPVPAPATARLLCDVPLARCEEMGELTTPTGAALVTTLAREFGPLPTMKLAAVGVGAGTREGTTRANILRILIGDAPEALGAGASAAADELERETVVVLEAQVDDSTPQALAFACERALAAGALDAWLTPVVMKKGRAGHLVSVLANPERAGEFERLLLEQTSTLGVRRYSAERGKLRRSFETVETKYGPIRIKIGRRGERIVQAWPEYEDCAAAALRQGISLAEVQQAALGAWRAKDAVAGRG